MAQSFHRSILSSQLVTHKALLSQPQKFAINSNPALFQSLLLRSYTSSTSPLPFPQEGSSSSSYLNKFAKATAKRFPAIIIGKLVIAGVIGLISVDLLYAEYRNRYNEYLLNKTFEEGTQPKIDVSDDEIAPRPLVVDRLKTILRPSRKHSYYHVVCGEHGTGKTTLARIASRQVGQGVIYVEIPSDPKDKDIELFGKAFGESLNFKFEEHISFTAQLMKKILGENVKVDGRPKWRRALEAFKNAGAVYKAKYNKLPVIIYDNVSELINVDPEVLDALQNDAKMNADHRNYIAVFVSSEGSVPRRMESRSAWSRADYPIEIGDLTEEESLKYLIEKRRISKVEAEKLYKLVGGRIVDLNFVANKIQEEWSFDDIKKKVLSKIEKDFGTAQLLPNDSYYEIGKSIISDLLKTNELSFLAFKKYFHKIDELNKVLGNNIFAYHPEKNTVTFQSQSVKYYILEKGDMFIKKDESSVKKSWVFF